MTKPTLKLSSIREWNKARQQKQKEKDESERQAETFLVRFITFLLTLFAMGLGMSLLPLFPQPLPILLAFLVAFITYQKPRFGMPIGGAILGLGLMFHLSELYFISFLGDTPARVIFLLVWMVLLIVLPLLFNNYRSALAIDFGILALVTLFFEPTLFLAVPLILASAVFFKKYVTLTLIYYTLLSVPLQIVQYYQYTVLLIERSDWWVAPGSAPPFFVSLSSISQDLTFSLAQFRLYDSSKIIYNIVGQLTWVPNWEGRSIGDALSQYLDSIPGIVVFVIIIAGLVAALLFFTRLLRKEGFIDTVDRLLPCIAATIVALLFFGLVIALQTPLAFRADVNAVTMVLGILSTVFLTLPVIFMDSTPKQHVTNQEIATKAQTILDKVNLLQTQMTQIKQHIPVNIRSPEGKLLVLKDSLQETLKRAALREFEQQELDERFAELDKLDKTHQAIETELNTTLFEYQIFSNCEFVNWLGKLKTAGLPIQTNHPLNNQRYMPLEERIETIKQIIASGQALTQEAITTLVPIYDVIQSLYDPALPQKSKAIEFAQEKIVKKQAPWIAIEALYNALNNWTRQYATEIQLTSKHLQTTLTPIIQLNNQPHLLPQIFNTDTQKIIAYTKKAQEIKTNAEKRIEKETLDLLDLVELKNDIQTSVTISNDILFLLYTNLTQTAAVIDKLLPTKDYLWEKNLTLHKQLNEVLTMLANQTQSRINQTLTNLPRFLGCINEAIETLAGYVERKEFLLNYPLAQTVITKQLGQKENLVPSDLPFRPQFAAEYLRLYYTQRYGEYSFDKDTAVLKKRKTPL
ncbi:MAG: hypothetical protein LBQ98_06880 [Nitrososphaerota archaeon]|nr:hypothetical protein [Nitrososphaerota archaeon]